jgi:hypothetical protein
MARTLILKDRTAGYNALSELTEPVTEPLVIERNGQTLGVLISTEDYRRVAPLIAHEPASPWIEEQTRLIKLEIEAYGRMKPELLKSHAGQWVAILDGELQDSDASESALVKRVHKRFGRRTMLIRQVLEQQPVYHMGGPTLVR